MSFRVQEVLPNVYHIEDALGVCMTLLCGSRQALLVDAGFGLEDLAAFAASLTDRPIRLILTHGHYDHILGAGYFPEAALFAEDVPLAQEHETLFWRKRALDDAASRGIPADEHAFLSAPAPVWKDLEAGTLDLGGLSAEVIRCPGHTPGSAVLYVPERELLLTGDDWNPTTWLFFREALPVRDYRHNMRALLSLPFRHVLCPHDRTLQGRDKLERFVLGLTDETLMAAKAVDTGEWLGIRTMEAVPAPGQILVFDAAKFTGEEEK
ncbi:MAG: MBL fold metallo-hydrolase [Oscillospiraceae bacterium]|nr:MBL fold metallo-hydrolase [Oscillospiraceae bacterium]